MSTVKKITASLLFILATAAYLTVPTQGRYSLEVLVSSYSNQFNRTFNSVCCKVNCAAGCDSIFFFCLRPAGFDVNSDACPMGSYSSAGFPVNSTTIVFSFGRFMQNVGNISNPLSFTGDSWRGSFQLLVRIDHTHDTAAGSSLEVPNILIDRIIVERSSFQLGNAFSELSLFAGVYNMTNMNFRFRATCLPDYYGDTCETFCVHTNNANGHYSCDSQGNKQCLNGFVDPATNCTQALQFCPSGTVNGVFYESTMNGMTVVKQCPPQMGNDVSGTTTRICFLNGTWSEVNTTQCSRVEFQMISQISTTIFEQSNEEIDEQAVEDLIESLSQSTDPSIFTDSTSLLVEDLRITTEVLNKTIDFLMFDLNENDVILEFNEEILEVIDNVLDEKNLESWNALQMMDAGTEKILQSVEIYGQYVAQAMKSDRVDTGAGSERELKRRNIVLRAAMVNSDEDDTYPMDFDDSQSFAQSIITSGLLQEKGQNNSIVNILFMNLEMFLPADELAAMNANTVVGSPIISTQILSSDNRRLSEFNSPARFRFRTREMEVPSNMTIDNVRCVFWDFSTGVEISETTWSVAGVNTTIEPKEEDKNNTLVVHCKSNHLTSFAVLLDVHGVLDNITSGERLALEIVTYIGLGVSMLFLLLTILILLCLRKLIFQQLLYFIHLNLSLALLLANTTFIAGIDNAVANRYACVVVAGLLHYLYTAAFYWMLCEGLMLFFKVVITFSRVSKYLSEKWWFFFFVGWGTPVIPVAVSIGLIHEQYGNDRYCWITVSDYRGGALWSFVVPFAVVILLNTFIFVAALIRIFNSRKGKLEHSDSRSQKLCRLLIYNGLSILPLLGLTWVFGLFAVNQATTVFLWLFTIFNSLQGAMIFFFQILRNPKIWNTLKKKRRDTSTTGKSRTQSTSVSGTKGSSVHKMYRITSSSSSTRNSMVSSQSVTYKKSSSVSKFKSAAGGKNNKPSLTFTNPLADDDSMTKEDLSKELFETS